MSKIESRLEKLESQVRSMAQHYLWLDTGEDGDAKIADLIATGCAKAGDEFVLVSWMDAERP